MDIPQLLADFGDWAYDRHANPLSWYIRPLFLLPLALSPTGAAAGASPAPSSPWPPASSGSPAPARPDPQILAFLNVEQEWLTGDWKGGKVLLALPTPSSLAAFCLALWRRSVVWGLVILNLMAGGKVLWGVVSGDGTGWAMTAPALVGLGIGDVAFL